jgi:hypothetical protein
VERPRQIGRFEAFALSACAIDIVATLTAIHRVPKGILSAVVGSVIAVLLILWVSRGRSLIGRIALTIWLALGIIANIATYTAIVSAGRLAHPNPTLLALSLIGFTLNIVALVFAWSPASTSWLRTKAS